MDRSRPSRPCTIPILPPPSARAGGTRPAHPPLRPARRGPRADWGEGRRELARSIYPFGLAVVEHRAIRGRLARADTAAAHHLVRCGRPTYKEARGRLLDDGHRSVGLA